MKTQSEKIALVTGASSGIGKATAEALAVAGFRVFGTSRRTIENGPKQVTMLTCDVTDDTSVDQLIADVLSRAGRIDLLVNNAGFGVTGAAEESSIAQVRSLFETNFHGVVRVTNAVLPIMRQQGGGRILNIGSVLGLMPAPYGAYYSASKHAIEGYSESLDHEVREFGVRVVVIEPGATRTSFEASNTPGDRPVAAYQQPQAKYRAAFDKAMAAGNPATEVAATIVLAAREKTPKLRYTSGKAAKQSAFARRFLPRSLFDKVLHKQFGLA